MRCPSCGAENDDSAALCFECRAPLGAIVKGSLIASRYEILKPLGKGGMGVVYLAYDRLLEENVALKVLLPEHAARHPESAQRFRSEIKLARRVVHKNVCRIYEYGQDGSRQYIAMAFVDGVHLRQLVQVEGPFPTDEAFDIAICVADALEAVHQAGIIHRDLKTPNIMRDTQGVVRLMDFGIAKDLAAGAAADVTGTGMIVGSAECMSPEQWRGHRADARSDVYALGVVVYELFTGRVPFQADSYVGMMHLHVSEPPPLEGGPADLLPDPMRPVLARALAKEPAERFASAAEFSAALQAARLASSSTATTQVPARTLPRRRPGAAPLLEPQSAPVTEPTPVPTSSPTVVPTVAGVPGPGENAAQFGTAATAHMAAPRATARARPREATQESRSGTRPLLKAGAAAVSLVAASVIGWVLLRTPAGTSLSESTGFPSAAPPGATRASPPPSDAAAVGTPASPEAPVTVLEAPVTVTMPPARRVQVPSPAVRGPARSGPAAVPSPSAAAPTTLAASGILQIMVVPPSDVTVDGKPVTGSLRKIPLPEGTHVVRLENAAYRPIQRAVRIRAGEVTRLEIDFADEGVPRR